MASESAPERLAHLPKAVLSAIYAACDGDWRRVTIDADGGFTVHNAPQFRRVELTPEGDTARRLGITPAPARRPRRPSVAATTTRTASATVTAAAAPVAPIVQQPVPVLQPARVLPEAAAPSPRAPLPAAVVFTPPVPPPDAVAPAAAPDGPSPAPPTPDEADVPRHPRYLRARLRALGASVGPVGDDGRAAVFVGQTQVGSVTLVDYRGRQAAREWRDLLARVHAHVSP